MDKYEYVIVDENGYSLMEIISSFTNLDMYDYAEKYIKPLLPAIAKSEGIDRAFYSHHNGKIFIERARV
jgi:hypothetical protein